MLGIMSFLGVIYLVSSDLTSGEESLSLGDFSSMISLKIFSMPLYDFFSFEAYN